MVLALAGLPAMPAGPRHAAFVPWKVLKPGDEPSRAELTLFWAPASHDDFRHSELLYSDELTYASQCVAMQVVRPEDGAMLAKLGAETLPVVVLFDAAGREVARAKEERGAVHIDDVESMVRAELDTRGFEADRLLDEARTKEEEGDTPAAIELYGRVVERRCTCPRQGRDAQRALRKLKK
jgi:hypothetical protein